MDDDKMRPPKGFLQLLWSNDKREIAVLLFFQSQARLPTSGGTGHQFLSKQPLFV
jgi:hypothetical protein